VTKTKEQELRTALDELAAARAAGKDVADLERKVGQLASAVDEEQKPKPASRDQVQEQKARSRRYSSL
jgi:hypothetical protein